MSALKKCNVSGVTFGLVKLNQHGVTQNGEIMHAKDLASLTTKQLENQKNQLEGFLAEVQNELEFRAANDNIEVANDNEIAIS